MARQNHGPLSRAKGKLGGVVYQQYEGMQISREYQPVVKNPQTTKQVENRAKFKLSSQIVAQFKDALMTRLSPISIYSRVKRGFALRTIYRTVQVNTPDSVFTLVNGLAEAINASQICGVPAPAITTVSNTHSIVAENGDTVIINQADYNSDGELISISKETYTSDGTAKIVTPATGYKTSVVMVVGYHALTEAGRAIILNIYNDDSNDSLAITIERGINAGDIEVTNLASNVIIAA